MELPKAETNIVIQSLYVAAIASVLMVKYVPFLSGFLKYGKTLKYYTTKPTDENTRNFLFEIKQFFLNLQVPKFWFFHFYFLSLILSVCTYLSIVFNKNDIIIRDNDEFNSIDFNTSKLITFLISFHSLRRLLESLFMMNNTNNSKMNITHYLVGLFFYTALNLNIFINTTHPHPYQEIEQQVNFNFTHLIAFFIFCFAMLDQFINHLHLSHIPKYNLPTFGMFKIVCCPHYFDEILIYASIALITRNLSSFLSFIFVLINLTTSSIETKKFYKSSNNGKSPRYCIIPFII